MLTGLAQKAFQDGTAEVTMGCQEHSQIMSCTCLTALEAAAEVMLGCTDPIPSVL